MHIEIFINILHIPGDIKDVKMPQYFNFAEFEALYKQEVKAKIKFY